MRVKSILFLPFVTSLFTTKTHAFVPNRTPITTPRPYTTKSNRLSRSSSSSGSKTHYSHPSVWTTEAPPNFVDPDENLEPGEVCLLALKAFASGSGPSPRFLSAGALVLRPPPTPPTDSSSCTTTTTTFYDAWTADAIGGDTGGPNLQIRGALSVLDRLFLQFLRRHSSGEDDAVLVVRCGTEGSDFTVASYRAAVLRGFRPDEEEDGMVVNFVEAVKAYTRVGLEEGDDEDGRRSVTLEVLGHLRSRKAGATESNEFDDRTSTMTS